MSDGYTERHHDQLLEQLHRLNAGLEVLNQSTDRTNRHLADVSAKVESTLRFFVQAWQEVRRQDQRGEQPGP